jgi:hypothetical protein
MADDTKNLSIAEYFKLKGLRDAKRIEVTYEDGSKVAIEGPVASSWWRFVHILVRDAERSRPDVYNFRPVDAAGNLRSLTLEEMIAEHDWSTGFCSLAGHMRKASSTYEAIIKQGEAALPAILEYLRDNGCGMNIVLLLTDIAKTSPYIPEPVGATGIAKYAVKECRQAWLDWGMEKGYIKLVEPRGKES